MATDTNTDTERTDEAAFADRLEEILMRDMTEDEHRMAAAADAMAQGAGWYGEEW